MTRLPEIPGYHVGDLLGGGADSEVYRATRTGDGGPFDVAIKVMRPFVGEGAVIAEARFRQETAALACLDHPGLVRLVEAGYGDRPYLVTELIDGRTLAHELAEGPIAEPRLLAIAGQLAAALAEVHRHGLIHRDLKPRNVMSTRSHEVKILDFGLATREDGDGAKGDEVVGTFLYSAPEQTRIVHRNVDCRADLYSLGCILFECATGRPPFQADDVAELLHMHAAVRPPDVRALRPEIRKALAEIIAMLLAKDPDDRYQTARGLLADLQAIDAIEAARRSGRPYSLDNADAALCAAAWEAPLCGRAGELRRLTTLWQRARGGEGAVVQIEGESGSGKSRLVRELVAVARESPTLVMTGKAQAAEKTPFGPLREAIDGVVYAARADGDPQALRDRLTRAAGAGAGIVKRLSKGLAVWLDDAPDVPPLDPASEQDRFYRKVAQFLADLANEYGSALLVIDDVQWLDDGTAAILHALAAWLPTTPLLIATTARDDADSEPARQRFVDRIGEDRLDRVVLAPLDRDAVADVAAAHLGQRPLDDEIVEWLASRTSGNPFALGEYIRAMLEQGLLTPAARGWKVDRDRARGLVLTNDVLDVVVKRAANLHADAQRVLSHAAVLGFSFELDVLLRTMAGSESSVLHGVEQAVRANLIEPIDRGYAFIHDRIQEAFLESLDPEPLRRIHRAAAAAIESSAEPVRNQVFRLATHHVGGQTDDDARRVYETALAAGLLALEDFSNEVAYQWLRCAIEVADDLPLDGGERYHLREALGTSCARTGRLGDAKEHFGAALELAGDAEQRAHLHHLMSLTLSSEGRNEAAWEECQKALRHIGAAFPSSRFLQVLSLIRYGLACWFRVRTGVGFGKASAKERERRELLGRIYDTAYFISYYIGDQIRTALVVFRRLHNGHRLGTSRANAKALASLAITLATAAGLEKTVARLVARGVAVAEQLGDRETLTWCRVLGGYAIDYSGDPVTGQEMVGTYLADSLEYCIARDAGLFMGAYGVSKAQQGRAREVVGTIEEWLPAMRRLGATYYVSSNLGALHASLTILGRAHDGLVHAAEQDQIAQEMPKVAFVQAFRHAHTISALYEQGDRGPALDEAIDGLSRMNYTHYLARYGFVLIAYVRLAEYRRAEPGRERQQCEQKLQKALHQATYGPPLRAVLTPVHRCHIRVIKGAVAAESGRYRKARRLFEKAESDARRAESPWGLWSVHCERARLATRQADDATALDEARRAIELAVDEGWKLRVASLRVEFDSLLRAHSRDGDDGGAERRGSDRRLGSCQPDDGRVRESSASRRSPSHRSGKHLVHGSTAAAARQRYLQALLEVSLASSSSLDADSQCRAAMDALVQVFGAERAFLFLHRPDGELEIQAGRDARRNELESLTGYSRTVVERVAQSGEPMIVTGTDEGQALGSQSAVAYDLRSIMAAPLTVGGEQLGVIYVDSSLVKGLFGDEQFDILRALGNHIAIAIKTAMAARERVDVERRRNELMAILVHEIRNPLVSILGHADLALDASGTEGEDDTVEALREIQASAERLSRIVDNVLELSREEQGKFDWQMAPFDLAALMREVATANRPIAERSGVAIHTETGSLHRPALGDPDRVMQVLANLVGNALKFTPAGGTITIRGTVEAVPRRAAGSPDESGDEYLRVDVTDTGPGLDEATQARLFEKFAQGDGSRYASGLGLGLYISREIIRRHRGTIWVDSQPGEGATFSFRIPAATR